MHISLVFLISFGIVILLGVSIYFFTHQAPLVLPGKVTNITLNERSNQWILNWAKPVPGSDPIGYAYVIQGVTVPQNIAQGISTDLSLVLNKSSYTVGNDYLITIVPRNAAGAGPEASLLFTPPLSV